MDCESRRHGPFAIMLARARTGEQEALGWLWREHHSALLRYLSAQDPGAGEDIASETWVGVARTLHDFEGDQDDFRCWLFTIARRRLADHRRSAGRHVADSLGDLVAANLAGSNDTEGLVLERASTEAALALIGTLPTDQAQAVLLRVVVGLSVDQVARVMERTPGSVRVLAHRGLRCLARALQEQALSQRA